MTAQESTSQFPVTLTNAAAKKVQEIAKEEGKEGYGLKFFVMPGGCSGFQYGLDFIQDAQEQDETYEQHDVKLFVDKDSLPLIQGTVIDFINTLQESGFKINNPNVQHSCGCGKSFC